MNNPPTSLQAGTTRRRGAPKPTAATLVRLGPDRLAELLVAAGRADAALKRVLTLEVATDTADLTEELDRQIDRVRRGKGRLKAVKALGLAREVERLVRAAVEKLGEPDPAAAITRLLDIVELAADQLDRRTGEGRPLQDAFAAPAGHLGSLLSRVSAAETRLRLVERAFDLFLVDEHGVAATLMKPLVTALDAQGRIILRRWACASLEPLERGAGRPAAGERILRLTELLADIADGEGEVDAFVAANRRRPPALRNHVGMARRLIAAGRSADALEVLDVAPAGASTASDAFRRTRVEALESLGRREEAQAERWRWFQLGLSVEALREHLKRLADFEDVEFEQTAMSAAAEHRDAAAALVFFIAWPDLRRAGALVRARHTRLSGEGVDVLAAAAERLAHKDPLAAILLLRATIEATLRDSRIAGYCDAARRLVDCETLAATVADWEQRPDHPVYVARLRQAFGHRAGFWRVADPA